MKNGCLLVIAVMVASYFGYRQLLLQTKLEEQWWIPVLLAIGAGIVVANFGGILVALRQARAFRKDRSQWRDGDLVGLSGRLQVSGTPVTAPFSGAAAAIVEFEISRKEGTSDNEHTVSYCTGFRMAPCSIFTSQGSVRITGFPLLTDVTPKDASVSSGAYERAAAYLNETQFKAKDANPIKALSQLNEVLSDADGQLSENFEDRSIQEYIRINRYNDDDDDSTGEVVDPALALKDLANSLAEERYCLIEKIITSGTEVTAIGSYRASRQAIDIGSGLTNLSHTLKLGSGGEVTGKAVRRSVLALLFWSAVFAAGNYYVCKIIKVDMSRIEALFEQIISSTR